MNSEQDYYSKINETMKNMYEEIVHGGKNINAIKKKLNRTKRRKYVFYIQQIFRYGI